MFRSAVLGRGLWHNSGRCHGPEAAHPEHQSSIRQVLAPLRRVSAAYEREVEAVFALIAYEAPAESPLQACLLTQLSSIKICVWNRILPKCFFSKSKHIPEISL